MATKTITAVLYGGPLHGEKLKVERGTEVIKVAGMFEYTLAGMLKSRATAFAIKPKKHAHRRWLKHYIETHGTDPRIESYSNQRVPFKHEVKPVKAGRGAAKRRAKQAV